MFKHFYDLYKGNRVRTGIRLLLTLTAAVILGAWLIAPGTAFAAGGAHVADHPLAADTSSSTLMQYIARGLWYLAFLVLSGWTISMGLFKPASEHRGKLRGTTRTLLWANLFTLLLVIVTHVEELLDGGDLADLGNVFLSTNTGIGWVILLALSLGGFFLLAQSLWIDIIWSVILFAAAAIAGHASALQGTAIVLDILHLAAAAVWAGGYALTLSIRRTQPDSLPPYLRAFVPVSLAAMAVLAITGAVQAWLYLPSLQYVTRTQWGILLLVKTGVALLAAAAAAAVAASVRRGGADQIAKRSKSAFILTIVIMLLVGLMTHMSPGPSNKPLYWHEMGETMHMTARINPLYAGNNTFTVKVWVPEDEKPPKQVGIRLRSLDKSEDTSGLMVLPPADKPSETVFEDFAEYTYEAKGSYLSSPGNWMLEVHVIRASGEETVYKKELKVN